MVVTQIMTRVYKTSHKAYDQSWKSERSLIEGWLLLDSTTNEFPVGLTGENEHYRKESWCKTYK